MHFVLAVLLTKKCYFGFFENHFPSPTNPPSTDLIHDRFLRYVVFAKLAIAEHTVLSVQNTSGLNLFLARAPPGAFPWSSV